MNKKEKSINSHIDKAIGYSDKAHDELQIALNIALEGKGLSDEEKELLSVGFATGTEEAVERVADGSCNDEYITFANAEECWEEMMKHQPFGWVRDKKDGYYVLITAVDNGDYMSLSGNSGWSFYNLMKDYTFSDDTPFGIKVEE